MMPVQQNAQLPNCWQCRHFGISYEARLPYLCRLMGIKTRGLPAQAVFQADGRPCQGFAGKVSIGSCRGRVAGDDAGLLA